METIREHNPWLVVRDNWLVNIIKHFIILNFLINMGMNERK